ncbi:MAG: hypothetical protein H0V07_14445 [Propionibacteriales bacterium]|nr:hypothetical protein [Propionibacteriales bacterium]
MDDVLLISNADAGSSESSAVDAAVAALRRRCHVDVVATSDADALDHAVDKRAARDLVLAGGDGSLHAAIAVLRHRGELDQPTIGLIPLGTGNDFARGALIPLDPVEAAGVILDGRPTAIDIFVDDRDGIVVNSVHAGVGADAGMEARPWKARLGKAGYLVGAFVAAVKTEGHRIRVVAGDEVLADGSRRVLQVGIGNGSRVGGGTELLPDADPTDGLADVMVSFAVRPLDRLRYGIRLKNGTHDERHDVHTARAGHVTVSGEEFCCDTDGELDGPMSSRSWDVLPHAFTMMLPTPEQQQDS